MNEEKMQDKNKETLKEKAEHAAQDIKEKDLIKLEKEYMKANDIKEYSSHHSV